MKLSNKLALGITIGVLGVAGVSAIQLGNSLQKDAQKPLDRITSQTVNKDGTMQTITEPDNYVAPEEPQLPKTTDETIADDVTVKDAPEKEPTPAKTVSFPPKNPQPVQTTEVPIQWGQ